MRSVILPVVVGIGSTLLVALFLAPKGCGDSSPPVCYSVFGFHVPGGSWWLAVALAAGLLAAGMLSKAVRRGRSS